MAISRAQLAAELSPGLNALFGMEYDQHGKEYESIFSMEDSSKAFEEEVLIVGFGAAPDKAEGQSVSFDNANESYTARYTHNTVALAFALTQEAIEDNLYDSLVQLGMSGMKLKDIPGFLKEGYEAEKKNAPAALLGGTLQLLSNRALKDSPFSLNLAEKYGAYNKGDLSVRLGMLDPYQYDFRGRLGDEHPEVGLSITKRF